MAGWEENIRRVNPYTPGEQPQGKDIIKLNTNENPYPPSPKTIEVMKSMDFGSVGRRYPDPNAKGLVGALASYYHVGTDQIFIGNGSDDVLSVAFLAFFNSEKPIVFPDVTYSFYPVWAQMYRIPYREIPLDADFRILPEDYESENGGVVIANPNAPTGVALPLTELEKIIRSNSDAIVIVDEAYVDYGGDSALRLLDRYDNLVVVRTFSKSRALAGARIGFAISSPRLIQVMNDVEQSVNSYPLSTMSLLAGEASVADEEYFRERIRDVLRTRARSVIELKKRFFTILPSETNFLFAAPTRISGNEMFEQLRERGVFVRHFSSERLKDYLRITIGTDREMDALFAAIDEIQE